MDGHLFITLNEKKPKQRSYIVKEKMEWWKMFGCVPHCTACTVHCRSLARSSILLISRIPWFHAHWYVYSIVKLRCKHFPKCDYWLSITEKINKVIILLMYDYEHIVREKLKKVRNYRLLRVLASASLALQAVIRFALVDAICVRSSYA